MAETDVIIVNYNGMEHLETCLQSLMAQTYRDWRGIVVDNGSTDGSMEFVRQHFPEISIITLGMNTGFAFATNRGIADGSSPYVALINNDIALEHDWLERMVTALKAHPESGAVACKMMNFFDRQRLDAAGDVLTRGLIPEARGHGQRDEGQYDVEAYVFGPCAGAALYRRRVFERLGAFDESFFAFYEDIDLDYRMQSEGWKVLYVPSAVCFHKRGATMNTMRGMSVRLHVRNDILCLAKNIPVHVVMGHFASAALRRARTWIAFSRKGFLLEVCSALAQAAWRFPSLWWKRRARQSRTIQAEYLRSLIEQKPMPRSDNAD